MLDGMLDGMLDEMLYAFDQGFYMHYQFLTSCRKLRRQYIDDGGDEKQIFEMIHNLETEIYSRKQHGGERGKHQFALM